MVVVHSCATPLPGGERETAHKETGRGVREKSDVRVERSGCTVSETIRNTPCTICPFTKITLGPDSPQGVSVCDT